MTPTTYSTRPVQVEAMQLTDLDSARAIRDWMVKPHFRAPDTGAGCDVVTTPLHLNLHLDTDGQRQAYPGDWVIKDERNKWRACTDAEFTAAYQPARRPMASEADSTTEADR